jgi:hypothetical protein
MIIFDQLRERIRICAPSRGACSSALRAAGRPVVGANHFLPHFSENQKAQSFRTVRIPAIRGKIQDRNGTALAENRPSYNVILYLDELRDLFRQEYAARARPAWTPTRFLLESDGCEPVPRKPST